MSHRLYLQCASHNPPIDSEFEIYHNLGGLNDIFDAIKKKSELQSAIQIHLNLFHELPDYNQYNAELKCAIFFFHHLECEIKVIDEYGKYHTDKREAKPND